MKLFLFVLLCSLLLGGCSGAVRIKRTEFAPSEGWQANDKYQKFLCNESTVSVKQLRTSRLVLMGPIIPFIPVRSESSGNFEVWGPGLDACPVIVQERKVSNAVKGKPSGQACQYDMAGLNLSMAMMFEVSKDQEKCITKPMQYESDTDWKYCLMCTH